MPPCCARQTGSAPAAAPPARRPAGSAAAMSGKLSPADSRQQKHTPTAGLLAGQRAGGRTLQPLARWCSQHSPAHPPRAPPHTVTQPPAHLHDLWVALHRRRLILHIQAAAQPPPLAHHLHRLLHLADHCSRQEGEGECSAGNNNQVCPVLRHKSAKRTAHAGFPGSPAAQDSAGCHHEDTHPPTLQAVGVPAAADVQSEVGVPAGSSSRRRGSSGAP
jgi:hypothetical protein